MKRSAVSFAICIFAATDPGWAQSTPGPDRIAPLSESLKGAAKADFVAAQIQLGKGDFKGAYAAFERAYDGSKDPRLLNNMAICAREMHDYVRMLSLLVRYRHEGSAMMTNTEIGQVNAAIAAIPNMIGSVALTVSEPGAVVTIDGEPVGTTPLGSSIPLNPGKRKIVVTKAGFEPAEQIVDVTGGSQKPIGVTLLARAETPSSRLVVVADDAAAIVVDGRDAARGRFDGALASGPHEVSVTEAGKRAYRAQINLAAGQTRTVTVTLDDEASSQAWWPWVAAGTAVVAGLAVGGYFAFRTEDHSAAPVPTGTLGSAQLAAWRR